MKHSQASVRAACVALTKGSTFVDLSARVRVVRVCHQSSVSLGNVLVSVKLDGQQGKTRRFNDAIKYIVDTANRNAPGHASEHMSEADYDIERRFGI